MVNVPTTGPLGLCLQTQTIIASCCATGTVRSEDYECVCSQKSAFDSSVGSMRTSSH